MKLIDPVKLIKPEIIEVCQSFRKNSIIAVYGLPKTGKIKIAKYFSEKLKRKLFISDNYMHINWKQSVYVFLEDVSAEIEKGYSVIVEGILVGRLLRKGIEQDVLHADVIIQTVCNLETIEYCYLQDGEGEKLDKIQSFSKTLDKIWKEYLLMLNPNKMPKIFKINTSGKI